MSGSLQLGTQPSARVTYSVHCTLGSDTLTTTGSGSVWGSRGGGACKEQTVFTCYSGLLCGTASDGYRAWRVGPGGLLVCSSGDSLVRRLVVGGRCSHLVQVKVAQRPRPLHLAVVARGPRRVHPAGPVHRQLPAAHALGPRQHVLEALRRGGIANAEVSVLTLCLERLVHARSLQSGLVSRQHVLVAL